MFWINRDLTQGFIKQNSILHRTEAQIKELFSYDCKKVFP